MPETEEEVILCSNCGSEDADTYQSYGSESNIYYCHHCFDEATTSCNSCGTLMINMTATREYQRVGSIVGASNRDYAETEDTGNLLCDRCWSYCENCESVYEYEDNMCSCCNEQNIHNYSYRPVYKFYDSIGGLVVADRYPKMGKLYMGLEIELEKVLYEMDTFYRVSGEKYEPPTFMYAKHDGSLDDEGVEFVTMPATIDAIEKRFPWEAFEALHKAGARGWGYQSCGMHIHLSRTAFLPSHLYKFMKFQLVNYNQCIRFAGRVSDFAWWDNDTMMQMRRKTSEYCKGYTYGERYSAINNSPRNTIELRYFRSNILKDGIMRNVQWVQAIYDYTKQMNISVFKQNRWEFDKFVSFVQDNGYTFVSDYMERW